MIILIVVSISAAIIQTYVASLNLNATKIPSIIPRMLKHASRYATTFAVVSLAKNSVSGPYAATTYPMPAVQAIVTRINIKLCHHLS